MGLAHGAAREALFPAAAAMPEAQIQGEEGSEGSASALVPFFSGAMGGYMWRVRLSSFAAGAAAASAAGFYFLYKDHLLSRDALSHQVEDINGTFQKRYEALNQRITALEREAEAGATKEPSD